MTLLIDFLLHIDEHLAALVQNYGLFTYLIIFFIIFAETGFVFTPFLPGDSLLFAAGALAAIGSLNPFLIIGVLSLAAFLGDTANYWIGHFFGDKIIKSKFLFIKQEHIVKTQNFYKKHGKKTIILARFVPIVRTFAPFVAGIGKMQYREFITFNLIGGIAWVLTFTLAGYFFGNIPAVQHNFTYVIFAIIGVSTLPMFYEYLKAKLKK